MRKLTLGAIALAASTMIGSTASHATFIVDIFPNQPTSVIQNLSTFAGGTPAATTTTNTINFASPPGSDTIGGFLTSNSSGVSVPISVAGLSLQNTVFRFQDPSATSIAGTV